VKVVADLPSLTSSFPSPEAGFPRPAISFTTPPPFGLTNNYFDDEAARSLSPISSSFSVQFFQAWFVDGSIL